ncbi:MAG: TraM recognition domain-containing protein [Nitrospirales bacterium]|nr:TraM recognition domain-containing protein [Nitrospirales bacterium]
MLYVRSSLHDAVVKAASTMLITEVIQEVMRLKAERHSHVFLVIDEIAFLISETIADALATLTSFDAHLCLAYQSEGDLLNGHDTKINWKAVAQRVKTNSKIHLYYRAEEFDTAQIMADKSGTQVKAVTRAQRVSMGRHLEETWEGRSRYSRRRRGFHSSQCRYDIARARRRILSTNPDRASPVYVVGAGRNIFYTHSSRHSSCTEFSNNEHNRKLSEAKDTIRGENFWGVVSPCLARHTAPAPQRKMIIRRFSVVPEPSLRYPWASGTKPPSHPTHCIERDHRRIKQRIRPMQTIQVFRNAQIATKGIEPWHQFRKEK